MKSTWSKRLQTVHAHTMNKNTLYNEDVTMVLSQMCLTWAISPLDVDFKHVSTTDKIIIIAEKRSQRRHSYHRGKPDQDLEQEHKSFQPSNVQTFVEIALKRLYFSKFVLLILSHICISITLLHCTKRLAYQHDNHYNIIM